MKTKKIIWFIILLCGLILFFATGCKPKEIITERVVTKTDSTAVLKLQSQLSEKTKENELLKTEINRFREDNIRLQEEVSKYEIEYDTSAPIVPETGKPPVKKETTTSSTSLLEKKLNESEKITAELQRENVSLQTKNTNLEYEVKQYRKIDAEYKSKRVPQTGFNFRLVFWSLVIGAILGILGHLFLWPKAGRCIKALIK